MTAEGLTEAEREALRDYANTVALGRTPELGIFPLVERILADRLAAVQAMGRGLMLDASLYAEEQRQRAESAEAERDAARREERMRAEDHARAWQRVAEVEAERDALRERVEALASDWNAVPDYTPSAYDQGRVDQRHAMTMELLEVLDADPSTDPSAGSERA